MNMEELNKNAVPTIYMISWKTIQEFAPKEYIQSLGIEKEKFLIIDLINLQLQSNYRELIGFLQSVANTQYRFIYIYEEPNES